MRGESRYVSAPNGKTPWLVCVEDMGRWAVDGVTRRQNHVDCEWHLAAKGCKKVARNNTPSALHSFFSTSSESQYALDDTQDTQADELSSGNRDSPPSPPHQ